MWRKTKKCPVFFARLIPAFATGGLSGNVLSDGERTAVGGSKRRRKKGGRGRPGLALPAFIEKDKM